MKLTSIKLVIGYVAFLTLNISSANLTIEIENIQTNKGTLYISLINKKDSFEKILTTNQEILNHVDDIFIGTSKKVDRNSRQTVTLSEVPYGIYSIMIFQDLNENQRLDKWIFGPSEPYGFSKNPTTKFRAPYFEETQIKIKNEKSIVKISLI
tara:strand:+ start:137 stop:595 length:459 start_codon:yes stop_codon:yes gene_type:complete